MATPSSSHPETQSGVTKRLQSEVTCPLCLDIFTEPKRLPCEHVYCRQCLRGLALRSITGSISCPECRMDIPIPNNDVANFSTPHQVNRLIELYQENLRAIETNAMETKVAEPRPATCKVHNSQPLALYCETCQRLVCRDCVIMTCSKQNHKHGYVDEMVENYKADLNGELEPVRKLYKELSLSLDAVSEAGEELRSKKKAKLEKIRTMFDDLAKMLAKEQQHLTDSIKKSFQKQEDTNSNKKIEIFGMLKQLKFLIQEMESDPPNESKADFLTSQAKNIKSIRDLKAAASKVSPQPVKPPEMEVELMNLTEFENEVLRTKNFVFVKDDPLKSHIVWPSPNRLLTNETAEAVLHLNPLNVRKTFFGGIAIVAQLSCLSDGSTEEVHIKKISADRYTLSFVPKTRGKHELCIKYNNTHICGSPIPLDVSLDPAKRVSEQTCRRRLNYLSHGIACYQDRLYLSAQDDSKLVVLDCVDKAVLKTIDISIDHMVVDGNHIFATATDYDKVFKMDMDGRVIHSIGREGCGEGEFYSPSGIRLGKDNHLYVCDTDNDRIQVLDKDLSFIKVYQVYHPTDLDFDSNGNIYVIDSDSPEIKKLNSAGKLIDEFTTIKWDGLMQEYIGEVWPCSIAVHRDMVYALDAEDGVYIFTTTGQFMGKVGGDYMFMYLKRKLEIYHRLNWHMAIDEGGYMYLSAKDCMITCHVSAKSFHISQT